jgi:hypothetical protein
MSPEEEETIKKEMMLKSQKLAEFMESVSGLFTEGSELTLVVVPPVKDGDFESVVMTNGCCMKAIEAIEESMEREMQQRPIGKPH